MNTPQGGAPTTGNPAQPPSPQAPPQPPPIPQQPPTAPPPTSNATANGPKGPNMLAQYWWLGVIMLLTLAFVGSVWTGYVKYKEQVAKTEALTNTVRELRARTADKAGQATPAMPRKSDKPPVPGSANDDSSTIPGASIGSGVAATNSASNVVHIHGNVIVDTLNFGSPGAVTTSTSVKNWYEMPPTRVEKMLDNDGGKKVVGALKDVIFVKPEGWNAIPQVEDAILNRDYYALKNKGTRDHPQWVDAMEWYGEACEFRIKSLRHPVKVRFVLIPK